jgi:hypothetical protein
MGAFENPELPESAVKSVRIHYVSAFTAIWKKSCFGQLGGYPAPEPHLYAYTPKKRGAAGIFFRQQLRGLFAFPEARVAYHSVTGASIQRDQPRSLFVDRWHDRRWFGLGADWLAVVLGNGCSAILRRTSRLIPNF